MRKASQKRSRPGSAAPIRVEISWRAGDKVRWRDRGGLFRRDVGDAGNRKSLLTDGFTGFVSANLGDPAIGDHPQACTSLSVERADSSNLTVH